MFLTNSTTIYSQKYWDSTILLYILVLTKIYIIYITSYYSADS